MSRETNELKPKKRLGQHFLVDRQTIERILVALCPKDEDNIIEIGPGMGALTHELLKTDCPLEAIEIDRDLAERLKRKFSNSNNFKLHVADALSFDYRAAAKKSRKIRIVGNLPYNISTPLLFKLFDIIDCVEDMHLMLQLEVVKRLTSSAGQKAWGRLAILTQYHCDVIHLFDVQPSSFNPQPKVESAMVRLTPVQNKSVGEVDSQSLSNATRLAFSQRRKTLGNNLKSIIDIHRLESIGINARTRAETLTLEEFIRLTKLIYD